MLKPSSSLCNMQCKYCFYHSLAENREQYSYGLMDEAIFEETIKKAIDFTKGMPINLSFQGGEPLLRGIDFFSNVVEATKRHNKYRSPINYALQTNGTLIDKQWCKLFKDNDILIGLSLDGDRAHNIYRIDNQGSETFDKVYDSIKLMQKEKVNFNILTVLTPLIAENIQEIYNFFTSSGCKHLQFIPCLSPLNAPKSNYTVSSEQYTQFLFKLFELYLKDFKGNNYTSIRHFDNLVMLSKGEYAEQCGMNGHCTHQFVIEADGTVFPCDYYCTDEYALGNIKDCDFVQLSNHPKAIDFIKSSLILPEKCKDCNVFLLCRGGCKRESIDIDKCESYKKFLPFAIPFLKRMN